MVLLIDIDHLLGDDMPAHIEKKEKSTHTSQEDTTDKPLRYQSGLNVKILEDSFAALAPRGEELVDRFYTELFRRHPEVKPMFANTTIDIQKRKLLESLKLVIDNLNDPEKLSGALQNLGARHQNYGALEGHYDAVAGVLLSVMKEMAGDLWTSEISGAWMAALTDIKEIMLSGYKRP